MISIKHNQDIKLPCTECEKDTRERLCVGHIVLPLCEHCQDRVSSLLSTVAA